MPTEAHPYLYVGCNPINYTDPSGLCTVGDYLIIAGGAVITAATVPLTAGTSIAIFSGGVLIGFGCSLNANRRS
jgi:hypothetical protein